MKKLPTFRPTLVTKALFPEYRDVAVINEGECFIWAYSAHIIFRDVQLYDVDCHAFVKYRGRFYDSEVLRGSTDWQDLPATDGATMAPRLHSADSFKRTWGRNPSHFGTTWEEIEAKARKVLRREQASL